MGRFAQADTIIPGGVQGYDRYAYSNNNPVKFTDPSGHVATNNDDGNYDGEYIRQRQDALKCQGGNDTYCSYGELHPVETAVGVVGGLLLAGAGAVAVGATTVTAETAITTTTVAEATNTFCGGDMCTGEVDELSRFFHSGEGSQLAAETLAKAHNSVTLSQTEAGAELTQIYETLGYNVMRPFAETASADWAAGASGRVDVILKLPLLQNNIWAKIEYPALMANDAVTTIVLHFIP